MSTAFVISLVCLAIAVSALALVLWLRARALANALRAEREGVARLRADLQCSDARAHLWLSIADTLPATAWRCEECAQLVELLPSALQFLTSEGELRLELAAHAQSHHNTIIDRLRHLSQGLFQLHKETQRAALDHHQLTSSTGEHS